MSPNLFWYFETESHFVAQSSLESAIVLSFSVFPDAFAGLYHPSQICFVFQCWGLNPDPCACQASIFTLTPSVLCFYLFFKTLYLSIIRYLTVLWLSLSVIALFFVLILSVYVLSVFFLSCISGYSSVYLCFKYSPKLGSVQDLFPSSFQLHTFLSEYTHKGTLFIPDQCTV